MFYQITGQNFKKRFVAKVISI